MKNRIQKLALTLLICTLSLSTALAQAPQKMSYQAVVRDASDNLIVNQTVGMQISILQGSATGASVYIETQTPTTNANGLISLEIGTGIVVNGDFTTIDWANDIYFIKTETDPTGGIDYTITGTSQLMSVPYALHAKTAESITGSGNTKVIRWTSFSTYNQAGAWYANNNADLFGGVTPSQWSDGNAIAANMSSDKQVLLTLFNKKMYPGNNAVVFANEWLSYSSTNGQFAGALFRIENTTGTDLNWLVTWYGTAYGGWGERSSVTLNGADTWNSGSASIGANTPRSTYISIPANRVSTVIFIAGSSIPGAGNSRGTFLAFRSNCLNLPLGLKYVDDLDTAPNGWGN